MSGKTATFSFSIPIELSIQVEEACENEKIPRSEMIKKALIQYLDLKKSEQNSIKLIEKSFDTILEIKELLIKKS